MRVITTSTLRGVKVYEPAKPGKRPKAVGKVHLFIFHPSKRRVMGFTVKRPDVALMFHRSELFVPIDGFRIEDGNVLVEPGAIGNGKSACKRLGVNWDECILWEGLALLTEDGRSCGHVGEVKFSLEDGRVVSLRVDRGVSNQALLGTVDLDASLVRGFKLGVGDKLSTAEEDDEADALRGALIVDDEALQVQSVGGVAAKAGVGYAKVEHRAKQGMEKAKEGMEKARPVAQEAAAKAGEAVNQGAFRLGEQLGKTRGMFSNFKEAYRAAANGEDSNEASKRLED